MSTTPTVTSSGPARRRHRALAGVVALVAVLGLVATACEAPSKPSGGLFDSWKGNDADGAHSFATGTAVEQVFAKTYTSADQWIFVTCEGAAGSTYCTWVNKVETTLQMRESNASKKVTSVTFKAITSGVSGRFFHAWRRGSTAEATPYSSAGARSTLFGHTYKASDHWMPAGCEGAAGSIYCTWVNDSGHTIVTRYDNVSTHKVTSVTFGLLAP